MENFIFCAMTVTIKVRMRFITIWKEDYFLSILIALKSRIKNLAICSRIPNFAGLFIYGISFVNTCSDRISFTSYVEKPL